MPAVILDFWWSSQFGNRSIFAEV